MQPIRLAAAGLLGLAVLACEVTGEPSATGSSADTVAARLVARGLDAAEAAPLARTIVAESRLRGLEPALVLAVIEVESSFRPRAVSSADAYGLMQLRLPTARAVAERCGVAWRGAATLLDPVDNVRLGIAYLAELRDRFGHLPTALAAYNWGPTRIRRVLRSGSPLPERYVRRVLTAHALHP